MTGGRSGPRQSRRTLLTRTQAPGDPQQASTAPAAVLPTVGTTPTAGTAPTAGSTATADTTPAAGTTPTAGTRWPALDGMRAAAVIAVALYHIGVLPGGYLGVDVFFVLSGFLITSLLLGEWDLRARISFRDFYARRALRLFPALGCLLAAAAAFAGLLYLAGGAADRPYAHATLGAIGWVVAFAGNWVRALDPAGQLGSLGALGHTWSLAVEEQFYLIWPGLFALAMRRGARRSALAWALAALAAADMAYRAGLAHLGAGYDRVYYGADTHCDGLLLGCSAAFWLASRQGRPVGRTAAALLRAAAAVGAAALGALALAGNQADAAADISIAAVATTMIVAAIAASQLPRAMERLLCSRTAVQLGRRSYGLYLWQYLLLAAAEAVVVPATGYYPGGAAGRFLFALALTTGLAATFAAALLSYRYVEAPALAAQRRFRWPASGEPAPPGGHLTRRLPRRPRAGS